jgi:hypothetical protein
VLAQVGQLFPIMLRHPADYFLMHRIKAFGSERPIFYSSVNTSAAPDFTGAPADSQ